MADIVAGEQTVAVLAAEIVEDVGASAAGHAVAERVDAEEIVARGWIGMRLDDGPDWDEV